MKRSGKVITVAAVLGAVLITSATWAWAQSGEGEIAACVKDGKVKQLGAAGDVSCDEREELFTWNITGPSGADGNDGVSGYEVVSATEDFFPLPNAAQETIVADCPAPKVPLGGGFSTTGSIGDLTLRSSRPTPDGTGWQVEVVNLTATELPIISVTVFATCGAAS